MVLDKPIKLEANKEYVMVIYVDDLLTQTAIAFAYEDIFSNGKMYEFVRLTGGNGEILDNNHNWMPENSQDVLYSFKEL